MQFLSDVYLRCPDCNGRRYRDEVLDLDDLVREEVLLAMPYKPLCKSDCRGLCPHCGVDLNTETCQCAPPPDPRLAALRQFFKKP